MVHPNYCKWVVTPIPTGLTLLTPFGTWVMIHLLTEMNHQVFYPHDSLFPGSKLFSHDLGTTVPSFGIAKTWRNAPWNPFVLCRQYCKVNRNSHYRLWQSIPCSEGVSSSCHQILCCCFARGFPEKRTMFKKKCWSKKDGNPFPNDRCVSEEMVDLGKFDFPIHWHWPMKSMKNREIDPHTLW